MCSGSEAGSYLMLMDFVYHSTLGLRVLKEKKMSISFRTIDDRGDVVEDKTDIIEDAGVPRSYGNARSPRTPIGPWAGSYCRVLWGGVFL